MSADFILETLREADRCTLIHRDRPFGSRQLLGAIGECTKGLRDLGVPDGTVVSLEADYSPTAIALLFALIELNCIVVPLSTASRARKEDFRRLAQVETRVLVDGRDAWRVESTGTHASHDLYSTLAARGRPGLVLFSSGITGESKAAVHDFTAFLQKFGKRRKDHRTLAFLMFDHVGGLDALFYALSNGSTVVTLADRFPETVCASIERHRVEVLPTTPTFLNLLALSDVYKRHDLSSVVYVAYGSEATTQETLKRARAMFPGAKLLQKYGTTEVGTLRSQSRDSGSEWVRIGGEYHDVRVVGGLLQIKARTAMLGYLNAPSPFTEDGWFITGDAVEVDGDYMRILGRKSEIINVGGEKVFPAEVEAVILELENVADVVVRGESNAITGQIVVAEVRLPRPESLRSLSTRIQKHCLSRLEPYKVPMKVYEMTVESHGERFKKKRSRE